MTIDEEKINHEISLLIDEACSIKDRSIELREFIKSVDFYGSQEIFDLKKENAELKAKFSKLYSIWFDHGCEKSESECDICKIYYAIYGVEGA